MFIGILYKSEPLLKDKEMKIKILKFVLGILTVLFVWRIGVFFFKSGPSSKVRENVIQVAQVAPVVKKTVPFWVVAPGVFVSSQSVDIFNRVEGEISEIHFKEGQIVKEGDPLYTIDVKNLEVQLAQAQAALEKNTALMVGAKKQLDRNTLMRSKDIVSQSQLDQVDSTEKSLEAAVKSDQASIELIKLQIGYAKITSPITGRVGFSRVDVKSFLKVLNSAPLPLTTIIKLDPMEFNFSLSEKYLSYFQNKDLNNFKVFVVDDKGVQKNLKGKLIALDNNVNVATGSIMLKAQFENPDSKLWHGGFASLKIVLEETPNALVVPLNAVQSGSLGAYVLVYDDAQKTAVTRLVTLGTVSDLDAVIKDGLKEGELVIVAGQNRYKEGVKIASIKMQTEAIK